MKIINIFSGRLNLVLLLFAALSITGCEKDDGKTAVAPAPTTVTDVDGNIYHMVTIGSQVWMAENLKVTHFRNGLPIPHVTGNAEWNALTGPGYCNYNNSGTNADTMGRLYNWHAVADGPVLAPEGWHIPSHAEWTTLTGFLGGDAVAGDKLKETGTAHWLAPNDGATNASGFGALPNGLRGASGNFSFWGQYGYFWTSTENSSTTAWARVINNINSNIVIGSGDKNNYGLAVRCIKD